MSTQSGMIARTPPSRRLAFTLSAVALWASRDSLVAADKFVTGTVNWNTGGVAAWSTASGGPYTSTWLANDKALFEGTAGTVTLTGPVSAVALQFNVTGYTVAGSPNVLTLASPATVDVGTGTATISAIIGGSSGLTKGSAGALVLSGANTYTGATTVNHGSVSITSAAALPSGSAVTVNSNAAITGGGGVQFILNNATGATFANAWNLNSVSAGDLRAQLANTAGNNVLGGSVTLGGSGLSIMNVGGGTLTVNGNVSGPTFTGTYLVRGTAGSNVINGSINLPTGNLSKTDGNTWTITSTGNTWLNTGVSAGTLRIGASNALPTTTSLTVGQSTGTSAATLELNGFNQTVGGITMLTSGSGTKSVNNASATLSTFTVSTATANTYAGVLSGNLALVKEGASTLTLSGANTHTGSTTVNNGTLILSGGAAIADAGAVVLANTAGAGLQLNASETVGSIAGGGASGGNINLQGNTLTAGDATSTTFAGVLSGTGGALTKAGAGTLTLTSDNTYTGATTLSAGTLRVGNGGTTGSMGTGAISVAAPATLAFRRSNTLTVAENISGAGTVRIGVAGSAGPVTGQVVDFTGNNAGLTGNVVIHEGGARIHDASGLGTGTKTITLVDDSGANKGQPNLRLSSVSGFTLPATLSFITSNGGTSAAAGTIVNEAGNNTIAGSFTLTSGGGDTRFASVGGNLTVSGGIANNVAGGRTLFLAGASTGSLTGVLSDGSGALGVTKEGAGTWTIGGASANTYTGVTTVNGGTLALAGGNAIDNAGAVVLANTAGVVLRLNANETVGSISGGGAAGGDISLQGFTLTAGDATSTTIGGDISGTGAFAKVGAGTTTISGNNTFSGGSSISGGTIVAASASALGAAGSAVSVSTTTGSGTLNLATDASVNAWNLTMSSSNPATLVANKATPGSAGITHALGAATLGNNTLTVSAGANVTGGSPAVSFSSLNVGAGNAGTLTLNPTTANLHITGSTSIASSNFAKTLALGGTAGASTITGVISDGLNTLSLTKTGSGTWTIGGGSPNTYTGVTTVNGGTLVLAGGNAVSNDGSVVLANTAGATLRLNASETVGSLSGGGTTGGNVSLQGFTLTSGGNDASTTFAGVASGSGALAKAGTGVLTLTGANTHTGGVTISAGTVQVGAGGTTGSPGTGPVSIGAGSTLRLQRSDTWILPNNLSGSGTLYIGSTTATVETDYVDLTGNNSGFTGSVTVNMGGLRINDSNGLGTGTKTVQMTQGSNGNPHLRLNGSGGNISLPASISFITSNTTNQGTIVNEAGNNIIAGAFTLTSGGGNTMINSLAGSLTLTGTMTFNQSSRSLLLTGAAGGSVNGNILNGSQSGVGLVKEGTGTWTIGGAGNTYNGNTVISAGTLRLGASNVIPNGTANGIVSMTPASGTATLDLNGFSDTIGGLSNSGAGASVINNGGASAVTLTVGDKGTDSTFTGSIQDSGGTLTLQKTGAGRLLLGGNNTFQGNILTPNAGAADHGQIRITSAGALGVGPKVVRQQTNQPSGVASLELFGGISTPSNIDLEAAGHGDASNSPHLDNVSGNNTWGGRYRIWNTGGAYFLRSSEAGSTLTIAGGLDNGISSARTIQLYGAGDGVIGGPVTESGGGALSLEFNGGIGAQPGAWRIDSTGNTYTGRTIVRKQDVLFGSTVLEIPTGQESTLGAPAAAANAIELDGGELRVTGSSLVLNDPGRHLTVGVNGGALDVGAGLTLSFANDIHASGSQLVKKGSGTLNLTGTVSVGQLSLTGGLTDIAGATLRVNSLSQVGGTLVWGSGRITVDSTVGSSGSTDHSSPGYSAVRVGSAATVTGNLTTGAGSVLQAHGSPTFYLNAGVRFNQYNLSGILNLTSGGDVLEVEIKPYLLRPFSPNSGRSATDFGSIPLVTAAEIQGQFNLFTGVVNDGLGFDPYTGVFSSAAALPVNSWYLEYADTNADLLTDTIFFHYKVSGYVPEPGTMALSVFGLTALRMLRRHGRANGREEAPAPVRRERRRRRSPRA